MNHPRLDHGVSLPVAPLRLVVVFHRSKTHRQRPAFAVRPQTGVNPIHKTVLRHIIQRGDQLAAQAHEILLIAQRAPAVYLAIFGVKENQVDIRGKIEFAATQLAHCQHQKPLLLSLSIARRAQLSHQLLMQILRSQIHDNAGQVALMLQQIINRRHAI